MGVALPGDAAHVWLDASHDDTVWSRLVLARADHVVLLAAAGDDPGLRPLERGLYSAALRFPQRVSLVLVHAPGTTLPSDTSRWLVPRRLVGHHHVRADHPGDHHRAARLLCGRGLGLVLGGGGALGAAHVGLIAALLHRGVPIDFVGGTSAGGGIAAALAMVRDFESFHATIVEHFVGRNPMRHPTVPFISLLSREAVDETAQSMFGDATAEDLWVPWFCVSANLNTGRAKVHRRGPVWRAVRATSSIPVLLAPVVDNGEVLVDGSLLDNLPVETMAGLCGGPVIGSDVVYLATHTTADLRYEHLPRGRDILRSLLTGRGLPRRLPTVVHVLQHLMLLGTKPKLSAQAGACAWYFQPDLRGYGMGDYARFGEIATAGFGQARGKLRDLPLDTLVPGWAPDTPPSHASPEVGISERFGITTARSRR